MAMHVHASFSEQAGSMAAQLAQAQSNGVNVLWWTDHDHRMQARNYRRVVHFTSLTAETGDGKAWNWTRRTSGSLSGTSAGGIDAESSPNDPVVGGSLRVSAQSPSSSLATLGYYAETHSAGWNERTSLYGQAWTFDVKPRSISADGYIELLLNTSYHPATGGRPAGAYSVSYRFGGPNAPESRVAQGLKGIVTLPAVTDAWNSVTINPCSDIAALWPEMDSRDFSSVGISFNAGSTGSLAEGLFDYLRFERQYTAGDVPLETQQAIGAGYAARFPGVTQQQGLEMSARDPHLNWFGGAVSLPQYPSVLTTSSYLAFMQAQVATVHSAGGLVSYNHPYGSSNPALLSTAAQDAGLVKVAGTLLANRALGADILEVGYPKRAGFDLDHHLRLWDALSRNAVFLTGNGTNDDHAGTNWWGPSNNWVTSAWANGTSEAELLTALRAGRVWTGSLRNKGSLDLLVDGVCPMGSASVSALSQRSVQVFATGIPSGGRLDVLRGQVDFAGTAALDSNATLVASYSAVAGSTTLSVDTTTSCFVRLVMRTSTGTIVSVSNPVWLLRETPAAGIPAARAA